MVGRTPIQVARALADLGEHVRTWRKLNGLTAALAAERAGINRQTLRDIETGTGTVNSENLLRVLRVLGILTRGGRGDRPFQHRRRPAPR